MGLIQHILVMGDRGGRIKHVTCDYIGVTALLTPRRCEGDSQHLPARFQTLVFTGCQSND